MIQSIQHNHEHGGAWWHEHAWLPLALGYWCLLMTWQRTETAGIILKCIEIYSLCPDSAKCSKVDWAALHSTNGWWQKHTAKATQEFLRVKKVEYSAMAKSISWFQPDWVCISLAEDKTKGRKTHKQTITYSVTVVTSVPWDTERVLRLDKDAYGKKPFFSWTEVLFNHAVKLHDYWFVQW